MNLVLLSSEDFPDGADGRAQVRGRRRDHMVAIHGATPGRKLKVGVAGGRIGTGSVFAVGDDVVELDVELTADPPPPLPCTLVVALPRPKSLKRVLWAATSMGVKRLALIGSRRVEKSFWQSTALSPRLLAEELDLALEQAGDTVRPLVTLHRLFRPFVEDELPELAAEGLRLVADPSATTLCPRAVCEPVTLAVGPEGGWIPFERDLFQAVGFVPAGLGPRILRVEQAVPALLGRLF